MYIDISFTDWLNQLPPVELDLKTKDSVSMLFGRCRDRVAESSRGETEVLEPQIPLLSRQLITSTAGCICVQNHGQWSTFLTKLVILSCFFCFMLSIKKIYPGTE